MARDASSEQRKIISLPTGAVRFGPFLFDPANVTLSRGDAHIHLPPRALGVLEYLVRRPGKLVSKDELLEAVWADVHVTEDALTQAISLIRQALGDDPRKPAYVETVPRLGYRFVAEVSAAVRGQAGNAQGTAEEEDAEEIDQPRPGSAFPVSPDTELGKYKVLSRIGAGAMGEVWRARDMELGREVAVKVVPHELTEDDSVLRRFRREARLLAQVNHPNIATIYGVEEVAEAGGLRFIVMELLEGETLEEKLLRGPLPVEEAMEIGREVAEALEAAHEKGIIHRDLKPANVFLTSGPRVKVLDFGLAKEVRPAGAEETSDQTSMTRAGVMLGTAPYMSPEQVRGQSVDKRTDIWAFGCLLFELLTGQGAYRRDTVADTLAAILEKEPDWTRLPPPTPYEVRRLLNRCLAKDPRDRLHDIADGRIEIEQSLEELSGSRPGALRGEGDIRLGLGAQASLLQRALRHVPLVVVTLIAVVATWSAFQPAEIAPGPVSKSLIEVEEGIHLCGDYPELEDMVLRLPSRTSMALSPDGTQLVYAGCLDALNPDLGSAVESYLYRRPLDDLQAVPIPGTFFACCPFFSPDGRKVGFLGWSDESAQGHEDQLQLKVVDLLGGQAQVLLSTGPNMNSGRPFGVSWADDDSIVLADGMGYNGLLRIPAAGRAPERLTEVNRAAGELYHRLPHVLPGSKSVIFTVVRNEALRGSQIALLNLDSGEKRILIEPGTDPYYVPTGHILFAREGSLMAVPFDLESLKVTGDEVRVLEDVLHAKYPKNADIASGEAQFAVSESGTLVYVEGGVFPELENTLVWVDPQGREEPILNSTGDVRSPRMSPDGRYLAYLRNDRGVFDLWIYDIERRYHEQLTAGEDGAAPVSWNSGVVIWTPDSKGIVYQSGESPSEVHLYRVRIDRAGAAELLTAHDFRPFSISPESVLAGHKDGDLCTLDIEQGGEPEVLVATEFRESRPAFSPDGNWLAYMSRRGGQQEVYLRPYPGPGTEERISRDGGFNPVWSRDGRQLYFRPRDPDESLRYGMMVVDLNLGSLRDSQPPRLLPGIRYIATLPHRSYDVTNAGFVVVKLGKREPRPVTQINIILNWFEDLKRLVPTER